MPTRRAILLALATSALACSGAPDGGVGTAEFRSRPPGWSSGPATVGGSPEAPAAGASDAAAREVSEGDLYAWSGTTLLVLNGTRGLTTVDLADPARPRLLARV